MLRLRSGSKARASRSSGTPRATFGCVFMAWKPNPQPKAEVDSHIWGSVASRTFRTQTRMDVGRNRAIDILPPECLSQPSDAGSPDNSGGSYSAMLRPPKQGVSPRRP